MTHLAKQHQQVLTHSPYIFTSQEVFTMFSVPPISSVEQDSNPIKNVISYPSEGTVCPLSEEAVNRMGDSLLAIYLIEDWCLEYKQITLKKKT